MNISKKQFEQFEKVELTKGFNGIYHLDRDNHLLLKTFRTLHRIEEREKTINKLLMYSAISNSGYPIEILTIDEEFGGYVCHFFEQSKRFDESNQYTFFQKIKAIGDVSCQLRQSHQRGIIFNDINSGNQLISPEGGHLIDYEDVWFPEICQAPKAKWFPYYKETFLKASKKQDQLKQYISCLELLYEINFEKYYDLVGCIEDMPDFFLFNKAISNFMKEQIANLETPNVELLEYFDALLPELMDEEKIEFEKQLLKERSAVKKLSLSL